MLEDLDRLCKPDINRSALQRTLSESRRARMDLLEQFFALFDQPLCPLIVKVGSRLNSSPTFAR